MGVHNTSEVTDWLTVALASTLNSSNPFRSEAIARRLSEKSQAYFESQMILCSAFLKRGNVESLSKTVEDALGLTHNNELRFARLKDLLGTVDWMKGNLESALEHFHEARRIADKNNDDHLVAVTLGHIGVVHKEREDYDTALTSYEQALALNVEIRNRSGEAYNLCNIGNIYNARNEREKSIECYTRSNEIAQEIGSLQIEATTAGNLGVVLFNYGGDVAHARNSLERAIYALSEAKYQRSIIFEIQLARCEEKLGNLRKAKELASLALAFAADISITLDHPNTAYHDVLAHAHRISKLQCANELFSPSPPR